MSNTRDEGTGGGYILIKTQTSLPLPRKLCFCWPLLLYPSVCFF